MSLATRCPGCETVFRVTTQEATARGGTVRCGVCGNVFNALDALVLADALPGPEDEKRTVSGAVEIPDEAPIETPVGMFIHDPSEQYEEATLASDEDLVITIAETDAVALETRDVNIESDDAVAPGERLEDLVASASDEAPDAVPVVDAAVEERSTKKQAVEPDTDIVFEAGANEPVYDGAFQETQPVASTDALPTTDASDHAASEAPIINPDASDPLLAPPHFSGFNPDAAQRNQRSVIALIVLALMVLCAQAVYVWRNDLAAAWPASKPVLQQACAVLGCRVERPTGLERLSIESSELQAVPDTKESYTFSALLRSRSPSPGSSALRFPAIELTLTDALNQLVARRILMPEQYLDTTQRTQIANGIAPNAELPIKISFDVPSTVVVGYRAGLLYP